ncbi:uncharacterized protein LOC128755017 [Synchiropus splendidus]|uniref:uncharacterized protein LOC128755017 n=1 Tax=Synchiropus splendidus TaxID=270530 RepID=UPI00237D6FBE|nr:uncharacterized protein LOC128755017 [Synchiropus splendidus]
MQTTDVAELISSLSASNPFLPDILEVNGPSMGCRAKRKDYPTGGDNNLTSGPDTEELKLLTDEGAACSWTPEPVAEWMLTPPSTHLSRTFTAVADDQCTDINGSVQSSSQKPVYKSETMRSINHHEIGVSPRYWTASTPTFSPVAMQARHPHVSIRDTARGCKSDGCAIGGTREDRAAQAQRVHHEPIRPPRACTVLNQCGDLRDCSDEEFRLHRERIPTLQPDKFDGTGAWRDFLYQFESCARANLWSEETMTVQLRFSLTGAAGAIVHKNPRSSRWNYKQLIDEMEAAYGPGSEHAAATGIELRQRVRKAGEMLHTLRDDIYEKVAIVYADRSEREQDAISVEIFTNALGDPEIVQKLLEYRPRSLACAYEIAHRFESTRRAAHAVTQLMRSNIHHSVERRTRTAMVRDEVNPIVSENVLPVNSSNQVDWSQRPIKQGQIRRKQGPRRRNMREMICHNCSGSGHSYKNCPSPRRFQSADGSSYAPVPDGNNVIVQAPRQNEEVCVNIWVYGKEICALLDTGARRNVFPLVCYNSISNEHQPPIEPSVAQILHGICPGGLPVLGEIIIPVVVGRRTVDVSFVVADTVDCKEVILGDPFLQQAQAQLDFGRREITLFGEKVPRHAVGQVETRVVRVARSITLEPGCEYVLRGYTPRPKRTCEQTLLLSPTKSFVEKHHVLVAPTVLKGQRPTTIPVRVFNICSIPVTVKKGTVAGVLQAAEVVEESALVPSEVTTPTITDSLSSPVPDHLKELYVESCAGLPQVNHGALAELLSSFADVFSASPTDLGRTNLVKHDILTTPGPPVKLPPRRMGRDKQAAADEQGVATDPVKVDKVKNWPTPRSVMETQLQCHQLHHKEVQCDLVKPADVGRPLVGVMSGVSNSESHPMVHRLSDVPPSISFGGWTQEQLKMAQKTDPDIAPIYKSLEEGGSRPAWVEMAAFSPATKTYWAQWQRLYIRDGVILRKFYHPDGDRFYSQILLPREYRNAVLEQVHDGPVGGHFGVERTLARLKNRYFWYNMKEDVNLWCRTCTNCAARARPRKTPQAPMGSVKVGAPMERIAVDVMGPLNETERHNRYVLVVQDYFTKWAEAYPIPDEQAVTVADKIASEWVSRYGAPHSLHSDQGTNFESAVFKGMCEILGVDKTHTTPFHPQSDGQVERLNATVQKILAATAERCHWDWDLMLPFAVMAYRSTKHSSTGLSPNMMLYGREITEPVDLVAGLPPDSTPAKTPPQYVQELRERLELSHQLAREALGRSAERAKRQYDKNICRVKFQVGEAVWLLVKGTQPCRGRVQKFLPAYEGPFFVVGSLDDMVYRIQRSQRAKVKVFRHMGASGGTTTTYRDDIRHGRHPPKPVGQSCQRGPRYFIGPSSFH